MARSAMDDHDDIFLSAVIIVPYVSLGDMSNLPNNVAIAHVGVNPVQSCSMNM